MANIRPSDMTFENFRGINDAAPRGRKFEDISHAWKNNGLTRDGERLKMADIVTQHEAPIFLPKIINNIITEAVEPLLVGVDLMTRIPYQPGSVVNLPVMGAAGGDYRVGEEENYPEFQLTVGGGSKISGTGKYGLAIRATEEALRDSQFDIISMYIRQAGFALARFKEAQAFAVMGEGATVTHDNTTPLSSEYGTTTGRGLDGAYNGAFVQKNMLEMYTAVMANGFIPNIMIMHPLTWLMWVQDAQLRHFAQMNQSSQFLKQWTGNPAKLNFPSYNGGLGETGASGKTFPGSGELAGNGSGPEEFSPQLNSAPKIPDYYGMPMRIVVSPFMPFNKADNTTDIIMADSNQLGFFVDEHGLMVKEWDNPISDVKMIRMKERYAFRPRDRGLGVAIAKNVVMTSNEILLPAQATISFNTQIDGNEARS